VALAPSNVGRVVIFLFPPPVEIKGQSPLDVSSWVANSPWKLEDGEAALGPSPSLWIDFTSGSLSYLLLLLFSVCSCELVRARR